MHFFAFYYLIKELSLIDGKILQRPKACVKKNCIMMN